jgi:hypothetical protein
MDTFKTQGFFLLCIYVHLYLYLYLYLYIYRYKYMDMHVCVVYTLLPPVFLHCEDVKAEFILLNRTPINSF